MFFGSGKSVSTETDASPAPSTGNGVDTIKAQVNQQTAIASLHALMERLNDNCFDLCVPSPESTNSNTGLTSEQSTCHSNCLQKYMSAWNVARDEVVRQRTRGS